MKKIKGSKQIKRTGHIISAKYLSIFLILIFIVSARAAFADPNKKIETKDSWKEIKLVLDAVNYAWCGNRHIVFGDDKYGKSGKGIFIYDLDSGVIEDIANDPDHSRDLWPVSCTVDSRYVVFVRKKFGEKEAPTSLFVFDRETKTIKRYAMKDGWMHLSPYANYVVGPALPQGQKYILPGGKEVKLVPRREGTLDKIGFNRLQWSADEKTLFLFDIRSGRLTTYDIEKDRLDTSFIKVEGSSRFGEMRITKDNKLYVSALLYTPKHMEEGIVNLYLFDLEKPGEKPILLASDIGAEDFDMDSEGNLVYFKDPDDKHSETGLYYLEKGKKQAQLLKNYKCYENCYAPKISRNGKGIIFARSTGHNKPKEFTILIRN